MISIIAAIGKNRELGKDNKLLWKIPEDMKRFKTLTLGKVVVMGRKTYESLPERFRPLPNRTNVVVTKNSDYKAPGCFVLSSITDAIKKNKDKEIFIIGGASIYSQSIKYAQKLYLTLVNDVFPEADAYFPDYSDFIGKQEVGRGKWNGTDYIFLELNR